MARRVVITSIGVVSPPGSSLREITEYIKNGKASFERPLFDSDAAVCPVKDFNLKAYTGRFKDARYLNRGAGFSVSSAMMAIKNSGLAPASIEKAGIFAGAGPNFDLSGEFSEVSENTIGQEGLSALWILRFLPNTAVSAIARLAGIHGENSTIGSACAASLTALGEAFRRVKDGYLDLAFAGGGDSRLSPGGLLAYKKARATWSGPEEPESLYVPFSTERRGFIPGEGGAFFLLEELEHARKRGAALEAEILGYGSSLDGHNMTAPEPEGRWAEKAVVSAISGAGLSPGDIGVISAHGTGTVLNDQMEAALIKRIFGENRPLVTALKSWAGHLASACGAVELAMMLAGFRENLLPGIRGLETPLDRDLNFVKETRPYPFDKAVLLENFGFGGQNGALVIKKWKE